MKTKFFETLNFTKLPFSLVTFTFLLFLSACGNINQNESTTNNNNDEHLMAGSTYNGAELVFAQWGTIQSLDPHVPNDTVSREAINQIFEGLTIFNEYDELVPWLAESFIHVEPTKWEFILRQGVYFHDGEYFNADAVKLSLDRIRDPQRAFPIAWMVQMISEVEVIDDYTLHIHTYFPFAPLAAHLSTAAAKIISPQAILEEDEGGTLVTENPVGTGAFKFISHNPGFDLRMEVFDNYWHNLPNFNYLTFLTIPEASTRLNMLETGEVNAIIASSMDAAEIEASNTMDLLRIYSSRVNFAAMNNAVYPFNNRYVRRAMAMALNLDAVMEAIEHMGVLAAGQVPPTLIGHNEDVVPLPFDLDQARSYLEYAGYPDGFTTNLYIGAGRPLDEGLTAQIWQHYLMQIGITANIVELEWGAFLSRIEAQDLDSFVVGWTGFTGEADNILFANFHSSMQGLPGNLANFSDPYMDQLLEAARSEMNEQYRHEIYRLATQMAIEEAPYKATFYPIFPFGTHGIDNIHVSFGAMPFFRTAYLR